MKEDKTPIISDQIDNETPIGFLKRLPKRICPRIQDHYLLGIGVLLFALSITLALLISIALGVSQLPPHGFAIGDNELCNWIGLRLIKTKHGNAIDAAIAGALCLAIVRPDVASIAGCGTALVRDRTSKESFLFEFSCSAPKSVENVDPGQKSTLVGVPGFVLGLYTVHKKFGQLAWSDLFKEPLDLCSKGFMPDPDLVKAATAAQRRGKSESTVGILSIIDQLTSFSSTSNQYKPPDSLCSTVAALTQSNNPRSFYSTDDAQQDDDQSADVSFARTLVTNMGWSDQDLWAYDVKQPKVLQTNISGLIFHTFPSPVVGGPFLLSLLSSFKLAIDKTGSRNLPTKSRTTDVSFYHTLFQLAQLIWHKVEQLPASSPSTTSTQPNTSDEQLLSPESLDSIVKAIPDRAVKDDSTGPRTHSFNDAGDTTLLVSDSERYTVVLTSYLGSPFGNRQMLGNTGVHLNAGLKHATSRSRPPLLFAPTYVFTTDRECNIEAGLVSVGGFKGIVNLIEAIGLTGFNWSNIACKLDSSSTPCLQSIIDSPRRVTLTNLDSIVVEGDGEAIGKDLVDQLGYSRSPTDANGRPSLIAIGGWLGFDRVAVVAKRNQSDDLTPLLDYSVV